MARLVMLASSCKLALELNAADSELSTNAEHMRSDELLWDLSLLPSRHRSLVGYCNPSEQWRSVARIHHCLSRFSLVPALPVGMAPHRSDGDSSFGWYCENEAPLVGGLQIRALSCLYPIFYARLINRLIACDSAGCRVVRRRQSRDDGFIRVTTNWIQPIPERRHSSTEYVYRP